MSKHDLFLENPQFKENKRFKQFDELTTLLQLENGMVFLKEFQIILYKAMGTKTKVYFIITSGQDGSYIVNDFVSKHELPDFEKWPMTYVTLGNI